MQEPLNESGPKLVVVCRARKARRRKFHVAVGMSKSSGSNPITITLASNAIGNTLANSRRFLIRISTAGEPDQGCQWGIPPEIPAPRQAHHRSGLRPDSIMRSCGPRRNTDALYMAADW